MSKKSIKNLFGYFTQFNPNAVSVIKIRNPLTKIVNYMLHLSVTYCLFRMALKLSNIYTYK